MATKTTTKTAIEYHRESLSDETLLQLYRAMLKPRMIEEKMLILLRQGKISNRTTLHGRTSRKRAILPY